MGVYVDSPFVAVAHEPQARRAGARHGHFWCHMLADTREELHIFAARLGMRRAWFQPGSAPHYDLTPPRRALAVQLGARELSRREMVALIRQLRAAGFP